MWQSFLSMPKATSLFLPKATSLSLPCPSPEPELIENNLHEVLSAVNQVTAKHGYEKDYSTYGIITTET